MIIARALLGAALLAACAHAAGAQEGLLRGGTRGAAADAPHHHLRPPAAVGATCSAERATWISSYSCFSSAGVMKACISELHSMGVTTVYVDAWHNGVAYFPSPTLETLVGSAGIGVPALQWAVEAAAPLGIKVGAWFEYGVIAAPVGASTPFSDVAHSKGWVAGNYSGFQWMDITHAPVQSFIEGLLKDACTHVPGLSALQLDDHFARPVTLFGYNPSSMTAAASAVSRSLSMSCSLGLEIAPATLSFALHSYNVDWATWYRDGLFSNYVPQIYRSTESSFSSELAHTVSTLGSTYKLTAGIRGAGSPSYTPWSQLLEMLEESSSYKVGQSVWDVKAMFKYRSGFESAWGPC